MGPSGWKQNEKIKLFIIDEGEEVIVVRLLDVTKDGFQGLLALHNMKFWLLTATLTPYYKLCWQIAFQAPEESVSDFPTQNKVRTTEEFKFDVRVSLRKTKYTALQAMLDEVK